MKWAIAVAIALNFWGDRDIPIPCGAPVAVAGADAQMPKDAHGTPALMAAEPWSCRILISRHGSERRHYDPAGYCTTVVHEIGHLAGLEHSTGIMAPKVALRDRPHDCKHWRKAAKRLTH
jgi:hypothetical protein